LVDTYTIFDASRFAFKKGVNLIEASAGTGKTYAIGMIVLRAIVELGLEIDSILIVTFTKSATEELRGRIRERLIEARDVLSEADTHSLEKQPDDTLLAWTSTVRNRDEAILRLQIALLDIDRASIFTIHGFCQRMLVENALDSQQLFSIELLANIDRIRNQMVDDYWRKNIYSMDLLPCALLLEAFGTPEKLYKTISLTGKMGCRIEPDISAQDDVIQSLLTSFAEMTKWWKKNGEKLQNTFTEAIAGNWFKKSLHGGFDKWFRTLKEFFLGEAFLVPENLELLLRDKLVKELNGTKLRGDDKKQSFLSDWILPTQELDKFLADVKALSLRFRGDLALELQTELPAQLVRQGCLGFDDLISNLLTALEGPQGDKLGELVGNRFSAALIDEFQDTDSSQYKIFKTLFGKRKHYLYLIGDPKQAIYQFRGADIHTYFRAKTDADILYTLETNYRSHPNLVEEVNRLFTSRENPFLLGENVLNYHNVTPAKSELENYLQRQNKPISSMVYCTLPYGQDEKKPRWSSGAAKAHFKEYVVAEIAGLLAPSSNVQCLGSKERQLSPKDIGVLVRANKDAEEYRAALADVGIQAVLASRKSVYKTIECRNILTLMQAVFLPVDVTKLKSAMALNWFGFSGNMLYSLWQDEEKLAAWQDKMAEYSRLWQEQTFLVMMTTLLEKEQVFVHLGAEKFAERSISNILQLLELIQEQESSENMGAGQLQRWLHKMHLEESKGEDGELLLESDEEAVQLVTMHSAKGLEYPVVFCPVLWHGADYLGGEKDQVEGRDGDQVVVDLGSREFEERKVDAGTQQRAEDLRLVYVALTRAKLRCYIMWGDVKKAASVVDAFDSALGYLLFPDGYCSHSEQVEMFDRLAEQLPVEHVKIPRDVIVPDWTSMDSKDNLQARQKPGRSLYTDWQMSSFSSLSALSDYEHEPMADQMREDREDGENQDTIPVTGLPAGPNFGNLIHDLLEAFPFAQLSSPEEDQDVIRLCEKKSRRYGVQGELDKILSFLGAIVTSVLPSGFSLVSLDDKKCLKEMMFYYHLSPLSTKKINKILAGEPGVQPLIHKEMRGYLTGFVDLICEYQGKYYLIDYKTNYLGELMEDYSAEMLASAMKSHNYGLQYWIYSLILHRHLSNLFSDYRYEKHFGGVMYLFLRGMSPTVDGNGVFSSIPDYNKLVELERVIGGGEDA